MNPLFAEAIPLFSHQSEAIKRSESKVGLALFHDPGLGKTRSIIEIYARKRLETPNLKMIVVCPISIIHSSWGGGVGEWSNFSYADNFDEEADVYVINYEKVIIMKRYYQMQNILKKHPVMFVLDESHKTKDPRSKRSRALHKLSHYAKYRFVLSGTPAPNNETEYWSQLEFMYPNLFGMSYTKFQQEFFFINLHGSRIPIVSKYNGEYLKRGGKFELKPERREEFYKMIAPYIHRVRLDEVDDLPGQTFIERDVLLSDKEVKMYQEISEKMITEIKRDAQTVKVKAGNAAMRILHLREITSGFLYPREENGVESEFERFGNSKLKALEELVQEIYPRQIIVYAQFKEDNRAICDMLAKKKISCASLCGDTIDKEDSINGFIKGKYSVLVAHPLSGGVGLNLQNCSHMIFYSLSYSYSDFAQTTGRIYRKGQKNHCFYYFLLGKTGPAQTVDHNILRIIQKKKGLSELFDEFMATHG